MSEDLKDIFKLLDKLVRFITVLRHQASKAEIRPSTVASLMADLDLAGDQELLDRLSHILVFPEFTSYSEAVRRMLLACGSKEIAEADAGNRVERFISVRPLSAMREVDKYVEAAIDYIYKLVAEIWSILIDLEGFEDERQEEEGG
jgi:hypothetical protein